MDDVGPSPHGRLRIDSGAPGDQLHARERELAEHGPRQGSQRGLVDGMQAAEQERAARQQWLEARRGLGGEVVDIE